MALRGRSNILRKGRGFTAPAPTVQPVKEEVVSLASPFDFNATPFASTVTSPIISEPEPVKVMGSRTEPTTTPKLTESTMYGTQHRFQPKTPELLQAESLVANLDVDFMNEAMGGFKLGPLGSGITPEFLETIEPTLQDKSLADLGLTREEVDPDIFKDTESFLEFEEKATKEQQETQLGNLQTLAAEDPTQFGTVWPTIETQDQLRYIDELNVDEDERLNLFAQSLTMHANNLNPETGEPIKQYVVAEGKVWDTGGWGNKTFFWETADVPNQVAGQSFDSGGVLEFALNNPVTQIAGMVNPVVALATTAAKAATGMKVTPMEIASSLLTGLNVAGVTKPPALGDIPAGGGPPQMTQGTGLFGTTYGQTQTALNVAAAGDAKGAAIALVGNDLIKGGLDKVGLDQATIERAGIQYDDFEAGLGKTVQKLASGEELDEALAYGLGTYIREGGTLGSIDLPESNIDLGVIEDVVRDIVRPIGKVGTALADFVEEAMPDIDVDIDIDTRALRPLEDVIKAGGRATEDVVRAAGSVIDDTVIQPIREAGKEFDDVVTQPVGDALSALDTAVRQALPDIDLPSVDLPSIDLPFDLLPSLMSDTGQDFIPSPTRTTDSLFNDELFKFETEIGISDYPLVDEELELFYPESALQLDYGRDADNFFENTIYEAKPRSYDF
jgi:hypothetical protein